MSTNPIQLVAQELETTGVTLSEEIIAADPQEFPAVSEGQKRITAFLLWEAAGAVENSPYTLNFWLEAEDALETQSPMLPPSPPLPPPTE